MTKLNIRGKSTVYALSYTFADDESHRVENNPEIILSEGNIHCYTNDAYYGNSGVVEAELRANDVLYWTRAFRPYDMVFKNLNAGSNAKIVIVGILKEG